MAKVVVEVKDKVDDKEKAIVTIKMRGIKNATDTEKNTSAMIYNKVCEVLKSLN